MALTVGVDAGSAAVKALVLADGRPLAWLADGTGADLKAQCAGLLARVLECPQVNGLRPDGVCATGFGRNLVEDASGRVSEIMANALGTGWMWRHWDELADVFGAPPHPYEQPDPFRTVVDVGGQDSKVITFAHDGLVDQFAMNDRCAAGTGRFLGMMARVMGVDLVTMDELAVAAQDPARISSTCTVFAESEVVSLLAEGRDRAEVAAGLYEGVAGRVAGLARQVGAGPTVMFDGGPSHSRALRRALGRALGCEAAVPPRGEFVTALGAAIHAARQ